MTPIPIPPGGDGLAIAVSLTHDTAPRVRDYIRATLPAARSLLIAAPSCGPSARAVACGRHAFDLAESLAARAKAVEAIDVEGEAVAAPKKLSGRWSIGFPKPDHCMIPTARNQQ
jgi:hypothetical protein